MTKTFKCYSTDGGEEFRHSQIGDALDHLSCDFNPTPGMTIYEGDAEQKMPSYYFDVDRLFEDMGERASDDCGEYAEDFPEVSPEKRAELAALIGEWLDKNLTVSFYQVSNSKEIVLTAEMIAEHNS